MPIILGDSAKILKQFNDECIDLTVTSPPYDNVRIYQGNSQFDFKVIAQELYRVTKSGGIVIWVVGDATIDGDESGTSFRQALYFKEIGFKLHDTMILRNKGFTIPSSQKMGRYHQVFQYAFVLSKQFVKTFNPLIDKVNTTIGGRRNKRNGDKLHTTQFIDLNNFGMRYNVWDIHTGHGHSTLDNISYNHPAIMSEKLCTDLIKSWSNEGGLILDPFCGSGTTCKAAHQLNRKWIGIEINEEYIQIAKKRLIPYLQQQRLEGFIECKQPESPTFRTKEATSKSIGN